MADASVLVATAATIFGPVMLLFVGAPYEMASLSCRTE
jgi:hypothetical protein